MKFLFRKKWKRGKTYSEKLPWVVIQTDLLEARLGSSSSRGSSRSSSRCSSRSNSPCPDSENGGGSEWCGRWCGRWCGWLCVVRLAQFSLCLTLVAAATHLIIAAFTSMLIATPTPRPRPPVPSLPEHQLPRPEPSKLLDLHDFHYVQEAGEVCSPARLFFVFLVHSRPDHFRQRQAIRATWGGHKDLDGGWAARTVFLLQCGWAARTVFLLGQGSGGGGEAGEEDGMGGLEVRELVEQEARRHGDLVVGSFTDHYHNLTYKHVMALRWAADHCAHATYLVKADDDAFIDVPALRALLGRTFPLPPPRRTLACNVLPAGTQPQRTGKWAVSEVGYPWPEYPRYCAGLAYVATPDLADKLSRVAEAGVATRIWVDDVWVTGLLAESLSLQPHYLNLRYSFDHNEMAAWATRAKPAAPPPYIFAHLDPACPDWRPTLHTLWHHALSAHHVSSTTPTPSSTSTTSRSR
ncbi:LOW QUALITY PROTEIN: lactosylceramide 1,3-N-acetyl-beta-D-glucosaminyltransferase A-like [Homarus americanus]|uniref:LOW QUALITY PROTEIN: lactosylceramide 1,3-N-acetyl-beta-D-glucosaminyltransferase A-like n=1 Tax=Homarus americanus TaxID=6706 RepID=UPI001C4660F1|nr:LOW QUALITY PROTEIN: lactosylceramide 1,3-N-acetyl-beta-D-glucosaminyltransferase A-like [Homarus americanus]